MELIENVQINKLLERVTIHSFRNKQRIVEELKIIQNKYPKLYSKVLEKYEDYLIEEYINKYAEDFSRIVSIFDSIENINLEKFENAIINKNDLNVMYEYVINIKGANSSKIIDQMIKRLKQYADLIGKPKIEWENAAFKEEIIDMHCFNKLAPIHLKQRDAEYYENFKEEYNKYHISRPTPEMDKKHKLADACFKLAFEFQNYQRIENKNISIEQLQQVVIEAGVPFYLMLFAKDIKGADVQQLTKRFLEIGNVEYASSFATIEGVEIDSFEDLVCQKGNFVDIYEFAKSVKGSDENKLVKAFVKEAKKQKDGRLRIEKHLNQEYNPVNFDKEYNISFEKTYTLDDYAKRFAEIAKNKENRDQLFEIFAKYNQENGYVYVD